MAKNTLADLRDHLFESLEKVKSGEMDPDHAKAVVEISRQITDSARAELEYGRLMADQLGQTAEVDDSFFRKKKLLTVGNGDKKGAA